MAEKIKKYLTTGTVRLVVVGSGHMAGEKGILHHLSADKDRSYRMEQVNALGRPIPEEKVRSGDDSEQ
jgi:uncharacterized protein YbaP (TraB family)